MSKDQAPDAAERAAQMFGALDERFLGHLDTLRAQFAKSRLGIALQGAEVRQIRSGGNSTKLSTSAGRLMGWSFRETTGAGNATVYLRDGGDNQADIIAAIELAPHESTRDSWFPGGLSFGVGLFVDIAAGQVEGAVYLGAVD